MWSSAHPKELESTRRTISNGKYPERRFEKKWSLLKPYTINGNMVVLLIFNLTAFMICKMYYEERCIGIVSVLYSGYWLAMVKVEGQG